MYMFEWGAGTAMDESRHPSEDAAPVPPAMC